FQKGGGRRKAQASPTPPPFSCADLRSAASASGQDVLNRRYAAAGGSEAVRGLAGKRQRGIARAHHAARPVQLRRRASAPIARISRRALRADEPEDPTIDE